MGKAENEGFGLAEVVGKQKVLFEEDMTPQ